MKRCLRSSGSRPLGETPNPLFQYLHDTLLIQKISIPDTNNKQTQTNASQRLPMQKHVPLLLHLLNHSKSISDSQLRPVLDIMRTRSLQRLDNLAPRRPLSPGVDNRHLALRRFGVRLNPLTGCDDSGVFGEESVDVVVELCQALFPYGVD